MVAVDVGYGQLVWRLRSDDRVHVLDRTNVRALGPDDIGGAGRPRVADLSFISLRAGAARAAPRAPTPDGDLLPMVKPQFEVGRDRLGTGGVVRDPSCARPPCSRGRRGAELGLGSRGVVASPLPGPSGNVEYFLWLRRRRRGRSADAALRTAVEEGPQ